MCNLYELRITRGELRAYFEITEDWRREIAVGKDYVSQGEPGFVVRDESGRRVPEAMPWGFPFQGGTVTNVRNYSSRSWRSALLEPLQRCLVPVTRFQEWSVEPDPTTGRKGPTGLAYRRDRSSRSAEYGVRLSPRRSCWFLTWGYDGDPTARAVGRIHPNVIPVILHEEDQDRRIHAELDDAMQLVCAFPSQLTAVE